MPISDVPVWYQSVKKTKNLRRYEEKLVDTHGRASLGVWLSSDDLPHVSCGSPGVWLI